MATSFGCYATIIRPH